MVIRPGIRRCCIGPVQQSPREEDTLVCSRVKTIEASDVSGLAFVFLFFKSCLKNWGSFWARFRGLQAGPFLGPRIINNILGGGPKTAPIFVPRKCFLDCFRLCLWLLLGDLRLALLSGPMLLLRAIQNKELILISLDMITHVFLCATACALCSQQKILGRWVGHQRNLIFNRFYPPGAGQDDFLKGGPLAMNTRALSDIEWDPCFLNPLNGIPSFQISN